MTVLDLFSLTGRKAVVTGGNRGLGKSFVRAIAEAGADVAFIARDASVNARALKDFEAAGIHVTAIQADLTSDTELHRAIDSAAEALGGLDILVNNAGACFHRDADEVPDSEWDTVFDLNVKAVFKSSVAAARHMTNGGSIVNIGSMSGFIVNRPQNQPAYNASKAAVHHLTKSLAAEWGARGVRVNAVAPTYVTTPLNAFVKNNPKMYDAWIGGTPMARLGEPDEVASVVLFLASDAASLMTGSVVLVDGGYTCW